MFVLKTVDVFKTGVTTTLFCPKCTTSLDDCPSLSRGHNIVKSAHSPAINFATGPSGRDLRLNSTFLSDLSSALKCRPFTRTLAASARHRPRGSVVLVQPPPPLGLRLWWSNQRKRQGHDQDLLTVNSGDQEAYCLD